MFRWLEEPWATWCLYGLFFHCGSKHTKDLCCLEHNEIIPKKQGQTSWFKKKNVFIFLFHSLGVLLHTHLYLCLLCRRALYRVYCTSAECKYGGIVVSMMMVTWGKNGNWYLILLLKNKSFSVQWQRDHEQLLEALFNTAQWLSLPVHFATNPTCKQ